MLNKHITLRVTLLLLLLGVFAAVPALAGSAVIGSVAGTMNATIGGQTLLPNTTIFSGDSLQVKDGVAVVAIGQTSRMVFGRDTVASFLRDSKDVTVLLGQGNVSLYHPDDAVALHVKVGDVSVVPAPGFKTLGEVAMLNGAVVVSTKEGLLRVEGNGPAVIVPKGKSVTLTPKGTARAPQAAGGAGAAHVSTATALQVTSVAASGVGVVTSSVAVSRAGDARDQAASAASQAASAVSAANTAASNASTAATAATNAEANSCTALQAVSPTATCM
jgi:hypothetical protein